MKVTAALCWWDESVQDLERCVRGIANIADKVVAFDGAYRRYPGGTPSSPPEQAETIRRVAEETGLEWAIFAPEELWAGQVQKRSALMAAASIDSDWIVVVDTDHVIHADREKARADLARVSPDIDVVGVVFVTPAVEGAEYATNWHRGQAGSRFAMGQIIRALPDLRVEKFHWKYFATKNGQTVNVSYGGAGVSHLLADYEVLHLCLERDERHRLENRAFCNDREIVVRLTGQEDDVPGLPDPVYDFHTLTY